MYGSILNWIRNFLTRCKFFRELFKCAQCIGFWAGVAHLAVLLAAYNQHGTWSSDIEQCLFWLAMLTIPLQTSGVCYALDHLIIGVAKGIGDFMWYKNQQEEKKHKESKAQWLK